MQIPAQLYRAYPNVICTYLHWMHDDTRDRECFAKPITFQSIITGLTQSFSEESIHIRRNSLHTPYPFKLLQCSVPPLSDRLDALPRLLLGCRPQLPAELSQAHSLHPGTQLLPSAFPPSDATRRTLVCRKTKFKAVSLTS